METTHERDERLWRIAKARAGFKSHLIIYLIINAGLWVVWFLTDRDFSSGVPWPVWPALGWGIALAFQYFNAFHRDAYGDTLKEYEKLREQRDTHI
ncbi:MAG TPA: 2TM domain-containing protein [Chitinophaga sp.]|uniref:2TM domain-containing protein n=1 Tax=Chitinophaga sp. TaxID=1869181 RepID=UPI002CE71F8B|nr:2TM domain-containing protein [Chitinophaga sp.]HVI43499.1 2TM domain-containing protein [Chitinophaga sp.]